MYKYAADIKQGDVLFAIGTEGAQVLSVSQLPNKKFHIVAGILGDIPATASRLRSYYEYPNERMLVIEPEPSPKLPVIGQPLAPNATCCNHNCDQGRKCPLRVKEP